MSIRSNLPYDVWTSIVDSLVEPVKPFDFSNSVIGTRDLQALSLVCKSVVPLCRKHIFSHLSLDTEMEDSGLSHRFECLLIHNPSLISYVRHLNYRKENLKEEPHNTVILETLKARSGVRLQSVDLGLSWITWNELPSSLKSVLEHLIRLPNVSELNLVNIDGIPRNFFSGCANLSRIGIEQITFDLTGTYPTTTLKPNYLHVSEGAYSVVQFLMHPDSDPDQRQRIFDFSDLKEASFYISIPGEQEIVWEVLQIAPEIESLQLHTTDGPTILWTGFGAALTRAHAIHTLRKLHVRTSVIDDDYDPLCGLVGELKMTAGVNRLEEVQLVVDFDISDIPGDTESWSAFDNLLVTNGSFPRLASVYIHWNTPTKHRDPSEVQVLKDTMFQSLKNSRAVELRFDVIRHD